MKFILLLLILLQSSCVTAPQLIEGKGAVYGILSADLHSALKKKMQKNNVTSLYSDTDISDTLIKQVIDYDQLQDLYVGIVVPEHQSKKHHLMVEKKAISPKSIALALGDSLHINNNTDQALNFYISEKPSSGNGFQSFPTLAAGAMADFIIELEGDLELLAEENYALNMPVFSKLNMQTQQVSSGESYQFEHLIPGEYSVYFWYWRLGKIQQSITIESSKNLRIDGVLTVNSVMQSH